MNEFKFVYDGAPHRYRRIEDGSVVAEQGGRDMSTARMCRRAAKKRLERFDPPLRKYLKRVKKNVPYKITWNAVVYAEFVDKDAEA